MTAALLAVPNSMPSSAGAMLYVYIDGTTTPLTVYTTPAMTTAHASPVVADAAGVFPLIYVNGGGAVSVKITDSGGTPLHIYNDIFPVSGPWIIGTFTGASQVSIPVGVDLVEVSGYGASGDGSTARYQYDSTVNAAYVTANPRSSFISANGRGFRLFVEHEVNSKWFGALGGLASTALSSTGYTGLPDDTIALQAAIDYCIKNGVPLFTPAGGYRHTAPLQVWSWNGSSFGFATLKWRGAGAGTGTSGALTVFAADFKDTFAVGIQGGRAIHMADMQFIGRNDMGYATFPTGADVLNPIKYINNGVRDSQYSPYAGIAIDPIGNVVPPDGGYPGFTSYYGAGAAYTAGAVFERVSTTNFVTGYLLDAVGNSLQDSEIAWFKCAIVWNRVGIATTQNQSRNLHWYSGEVFAALYAFSGVHYGKQQGPVPHIWGCNIGSVKHVFAAWGSAGEATVKAEGLHCESFGGLGYFGSHNASQICSAVLRDCHFNMGFSSGTDAYNDLFLATQVPVLFDTCHFETTDPYQAPFKMWGFEGKTFTFLNSDISGGATTPMGGELLVAPSAADAHRYKMLASFVIGDSTGGTIDGNSPFDRKEVMSSEDLMNRNYCTNSQEIVFTNDAVNGLQHVAQSVQELALGTLSVTINGNGTATFTAPDVSLLKPRDMIILRSNFNYENVDGTNSLNGANVTFGTIDSISGSTVTVAGVGLSFLTSASPYSLNLSVAWWSRYHKPTSGDTTSASTSLVNVTNPTTWKAGDRILGVGIPAGAYVTAVSGTTVTLSKTATATATAVRLYDADVRRTTTSVV